MQAGGGTIVNTSLYIGLWLTVASGTLGEPVPDERREEAAPPAAAVYKGLAGPEARNPLPQPKSDPPRLIWTGFKMNGDRSEIFLQTTREVTHELGAGKAGRPGALTLLLRNCRIHLRNNARKIDTRFFATPVQSVSARQRKKDVELQIALKDAAVPEVRVQPGPDGTHFVVVSFPPGRAATAATPAAAPAAEPAPGAIAPPSVK
jgi:hypothetical protein